MFDKILIANRGEIAVRVIKTARKLGIKTALVYSEADADSLAVEMADEAVFIGPPPASQSYLVIDKILAAVKQTGAQAVHPGFGFLSENPAFPQALAAEGVAWIGPNAGAIEAMGDKITSKRLAAQAGVNTIPGHMDLIETAEEAVAIAESIGFPVMIKASAGGGGKGMRVAWSAEEAREGFQAARNEARGAFGDERIFLEKFVREPRHIEIQVLGDKHGTVLHLNERECSIQRRNQKVLEEAPSPFLDEETRAAMGSQSVALAKAVDYDSAGTVEFVVDPDRNFYFLEMNTRLQVEHPVTELITGLDLVEQMIRVAAGEPLSFSQADVKREGWAMEARVYAEDPYRGFLPSIGRLTRHRPPEEGPLEGGKGVRLDSGVREGDEVSMFYDPMIAKLIGYGPDRIAAIDALAQALDEYEIEGPTPNLAFLSTVLDQQRYREGRLTTAYIQEEFPEGFSGAEPTEGQRRLLLAAAAYARAIAARREAETSGRITNAPGRDRRDWVVMTPQAIVPVGVNLTHAGAVVTLDGHEHGLVSDWRPGARLLSGTLDGQRMAVHIAARLGGYQLRHRGVSWPVRVLSARGAELAARLPKREDVGGAKVIESPMPGLIVSVEAEPGQTVKAGAPLLVVEAMKMENVIRAEVDGVVKAVAVKPGDSVAADDVLVEFE
ncbi:MAG: biotin carboxylase N-terminal domain-containing protein [Maricaulaceae bacterium]